MTGNLIDLRSRIKSVRNTQKITRAMKTISAAKLRRSTTDLNKNRPLMEKLEYLFKTIGKKIDMGKFDLMKERAEGERVIVAITSDKGLCGAFNSHIYRKVENYFRELEGNGEKVFLIPIGNKISKYLKKREYPIKKHYESMMKRVQ